MPFWNEQAATVPGPIFRDVDGARIDEPGPVPTLVSCEDARIIHSSQRPNLRLCTTDLRGLPFGWPILVSPYASGVAIWPLGVVPWLLGPSYVLQRMVGLLVGVFALLLLYDVVSRLSGVRRAAATVAVAAVSSPMVFATALAPYFDLVPPLLVLSAVALLLRAEAGVPGGGRSAFAGCLFGLALAGNLKMSVILVAVFGLALVLRSPVLRGGRQALAFGVLGLALGAGPLLSLMVSDPFGEVFRVADRYFSVVVDRVAPVAAGAELAAIVNHMLIFAVDATYYLAYAAGGEASFPPLIFRIGAGLGFLFSTPALVRAIRGRPADLGLASAIGILLTYMAFVALVYDHDQQPPNYAPVHMAYSPCLGICLIALGERLGRRLTQRRQDAFAAGVVLAGVLFFAAGSHSRSNEWMDRFTSVNIRAQEGIVAALHAASEAPGAPLLTLTYSHTGVFDALGATTAPSIALHPYLHGCAHDADRLDCRVRLIERLLCPPGRLPLRFVFPIGAATRMEVDDPAEIHVALRRATDRLGLSWIEEKQALTPSGAGGLALVRVDEHPSRRPCPSDP